MKAVPGSAIGGAEREGTSFSILTPLQTTFVPLHERVSIGSSNAVSMSWTTLNGIPGAIRRRHRRGIFTLPRVGECEVRNLGMRKMEPGSDGRQTGHAVLKQGRQFHSICQQGTTNKFICTAVFLRSFALQRPFQLFCSFIIYIFSFFCRYPLKEDKPENSSMRQEDITDKCD